MRVLSRTWQMLLKGIAEVQAAGRPLAAAEMVLVRIAYAADLPTPDEVVRSLGDEGGAPRASAAAMAARGVSAGAAIARRATTRRAAAPRSSRRGVAAAGRRSGRAARRAAPRPRRRWRSARSRS